MGLTNLQFRQNFVLGQEICVDEVVVPLKERFGCETFSPKKSTKWGKRMYVLADFGYVYSILSCFGYVTSESLIYVELSVSATVVLDLYNNLLKSIPNSEGYHMYVNRYYANVPLAEELYHMN